MDRISAEQYLNEAVGRAGQLVSECVNVDLQKIQDEYYLRAIFPCRIYSAGTEKRQLYDLPYLEHCKFTYVVAERYIKAREIKQYEKLRKRLAASKDFQAEVGKLFQEELLSSLHGASDEKSWTYDLADVITRRTGLNGKQVSVYVSYRAQAIEFSFKTERSIPLTAGGMRYRIPSKSYLKRISKRLHNDYLRYFLDQGCMRKGRPLPKGWMKNAILPFYCGITDLNAEKPDLPIKWQERNSPLSLEEVESILSLVPYSISIPLFSFTIFSVLKFFYAKYPSRISVCDTYESVTRKIKKVLCVSLEGKNKVLTQEAAELYCGSFLRKTLGGTPTRQNKSRYVHDGIVIYSENVKKKYRITEKNINSYLVMDACALFVNIPLPENNAVIKIMWDSMSPGTSANILRGYRNKVDLLIRHFILWIEGYFYQKMCQYAENGFQGQDRAVDNLDFDDEYRLWKGAFDRKTNDVIDQAFNSSKERLNCISESTGRKEKFAYLLSSFYMFTLYLATSYDTAELNRIKAIKSAGVDTLCRLCRGAASAESLTEIFSQYVSYLFETRAIVPKRGEAAGNVSGWFDPKRNELLLPYASYHGEFLNFCRKRKFDHVPGERGEFQSKFLAAAGFIQLKPNGRYLRADCKVQVAPVEMGEVPKVSVIRISLEPFQTSAPLSPKAMQIIRHLSAQKVKQRAPNRSREIQ